MRRRVPGIAPERDGLGSPVDVHDAPGRLRLGDDPAIADDPAGRGRRRIASASSAQSKMTKFAGRPSSNAPRHFRGAGRVRRDHLVGAEQLGPAGHLGDVDEHRQRVEHRAAPERIPRIHDRVVAAGDVDAGRVELLDTGHPAPLGIRVEATLEHDVVERVRDDRDPGALEDLDELEGVGVVVRAHRGRVAGDDSPLHAVAHRPGGHDLQEAGLLVIGLVAVEVDRRTGLAREVEEEMHLLDAVLAGPLVVRDPADDVAAEAHRLAHQLLAVREREDPVLREGDQPQLDDVADLLAQLEERLEGGQRRVADVDVGPDQAGPWATSHRIASRARA